MSLLLLYLSYAMIDESDCQHQNSGTLQARQTQGDDAVYALQYFQM